MFAFSTEIYARGVLNCSLIHFANELVWNALVNQKRFLYIALSTPSVGLALILPKTVKTFTLVLLPLLKHKTFIVLVIHTNRVLLQSIWNLLDGQFRRGSCKLHAWINFNGIIVHIILKHGHLHFFRRPAQFSQKGIVCPSSAKLFLRFNFDPKPKRSGSRNTNRRTKVYCLIVKGNIVKLIKK